MPYTDIATKRKNNALNQRKRSIAARLECINILGGKCNNCGITDTRLLCIDHINKGGKKEIKTYGGYYFRKVLKQLLPLRKEKYQLLCFNCNHLKRLLNNESAPRKYF